MVIIFTLKVKWNTQKVFPTIYKETLLVEKYLNPFSKQAAALKKRIFRRSKFFPSRVDI